MVRTLSRTLACAALLVSAAAHAARPPPWATGESRGEDLVISLVTFGPGSDVPSWFGHTALVVEDRRLLHSRLYNYGMFTFDERMLARFAKGRLEFWVGEDAIGPTFRYYRDENRSVRVQELGLSPGQRVWLGRALAQNVLPENRTYLYHHYDDNCATRPRDLLDRALDGALLRSTSGPGRLTLREHTRRYSAVSPPMSLLLDFLMNDEIDKPIKRSQEAFLPDELFQQVAQLHLETAEGQAVPLVTRTWTFAPSTRPLPPPEPPAYVPFIIPLSLGLTALALALAWVTRVWPRAGRWLLGGYAALVGLVFGVPGLVLALMWTFTDHTVTYANENLFFANPLTFVCLPLGLLLIGGLRRAARWLLRVFVALSVSGTLGILLKVLPSFDQDNWRLIALIYPVSLGASGAFWFYLSSKRAREETGLLSRPPPPREVPARMAAR